MLGTATPAAAASRSPARSAEHLAAGWSCPAAAGLPSRSAARPRLQPALGHLAEYQGRRRHSRHLGAATGRSLLAVLASDPRECLPPEGEQDRAQRHAALQALARQCALLVEQAEAVEAAAAAPKAGAAAVAAALRPWAAVATAGADVEAAEQAALLHAEAKAIAEDLARALYGALGRRCAG